VTPEGAKTPQGLDSGSRNNVTGHSHAYPFQPRFEILTRNRQEGGRYVIDFKDGQNFGEPQVSHLERNLYANTSGERKTVCHLLQNSGRAM
jgi:hypothetical protein